ncbi:MAG: Exodeoxyribonuclease 7 small subunit [Verrucomicrobia bacterium ADurb.Bin006]|jgi:exodeoxyribonuclease VII small subunit|nr:MAG: Exodeoxyribonuclease 7 small subunit [Verrucomicrobia bacterium ADurb.Bin006]
MPSIGQREHCYLFTIIPSDASQNRRSRIGRPSNTLDGPPDFPYPARLMSKAAKKPEASGDALSEMPFEQALQHLESVVEAMESDDLPLETLLARYEEGVRLLEACQVKLAAAEVRISQLEQSASGTSALTPMTPEGGKDIQ